MSKQKSPPLGVLAHTKPDGTRIEGRSISVGLEPISKNDACGFAVMAHRPQTLACALCDTSVWVLPDDKLHALATVSLPDGDVVSIVCQSCAMTLGGRNEIEKRVIQVIMREEYQADESRVRRASETED